MTVATLQMCKEFCSRLKPHPVSVHSSDVNLVWVHLLHFLLQLALCGKRLVAHIDVVFQREGELSVLEVVLLH